MRSVLRCLRRCSTLNSNLRPANKVDSMKAYLGRTDGRHRRQEYQLLNIATADLFKPRDKYWEHMLEP